MTVIIGAGPYGLSVAAHLASRGIKHRIFGEPMLFWSQIAKAGGERYLKSYCFGTNISTPVPGFSFADYNVPRGLETFEPCSIENFAEYGRWFQKKNVSWAEPIDVAQVTRQDDNFAIHLRNGEKVVASKIVVATGLSHFCYIPSLLKSLPTSLVAHTSTISRFASYKNLDVAVIGAGQSALEAAALLHEIGARPQLLVREDTILWQTRVRKVRSWWKRIRSPISGLGTGPKAWALTRFPGVMHHAPKGWRTRFVKNHLPAEGAWWLRERVESRLPVLAGTTVIKACEKGGRISLHLRCAEGDRQIMVDRVVAGTGYDIAVDHLEFLEPKLRSKIRRIERAPALTRSFESSVPGLFFVGPSSAMSFGPLFRFVVGAEYTARVVSAHIGSQSH